MKADPRLISESLPQRGEKIGGGFEKNELRSAAVIQQKLRKSPRASADLDDVFPEVRRKISKDRAAIIPRLRHGVQLGSRIDE